MHGQTFRPKSPERVLAEIEYIHSLGVREFHVADDGFTSNMKRAATICDGLIKLDLGMTWSCSNGIRVDRVNQELLHKMRKAGCYRVSFGIESGNQAVLDELGKKIRLAQTEAAVDMARKANIDTFGFFMFGFTNDTPETMMDTIRLARKLPLDLAKASLITPFPGSPLYKEYEKLGVLKPAGDYSKYNVYLSPGTSTTTPPWTGTPSKNTRRNSGAASFSTRATWSAASATTSRTASCSNPSRSPCRSNGSDIRLVRAQPTHAPGIRRLPRLPRDENHTLRPQAPVCIP